MIDLIKLRADLERDEGRRNERYQDSLGNWTNGIGHKMTDNELANYTGPWTDEQINAVYAIDEAQTLGWLHRNLPWWADLPEPAARGLANMCYDIRDKLLAFKNMLAGLETGDYEAAAQGEMHSLWDTQVKDRANRIAALFRSCIPGAEPVA